jgi:arylsulfatase A-like enzyme
MDVFPTIAEAIDGEPPTGRTIDGRSWMLLCRDPGAPGHEALFFEWDRQRAVRSGKWKLVCDGLVNLRMAQEPRPRATGEDAVFLSDLDVDPGETSNLRREHADVVRKLLAMHDAWRASLSRAQ